MSHIELLLIDDVQSRLVLQNNRSRSLVYFSRTIYLPWPLLLIDIDRKRYTFIYVFFFYVLSKLWRVRAYNNFPATGSLPRVRCVKYDALF